MVKFCLQTAWKDQEAKALGLQVGFLLTSCVFSIWNEVGSGLTGSTEFIFRTHPTRRSYGEKGWMVSEPWVQAREHA